MQPVTLALLLCCAAATTTAAPAPEPCDGDGKKHGNVNLDFSQTRGVGSAVHLQGQADLHRFQDGGGVHGHGSYDRVLQGPARGAQNFGAGLGVDGRHGQLDVGVQHQPGFGNTMGVQASKDLWRSHDGNVRVTAEGHYDRALSGPARGQHDFGGSVQLKAQLPR